jgi:hypothetical protein
MMFRADYIWPFQSFPSETQISSLSWATPISAKDFVQTARSTFVTPSLKSCWLTSPIAQITNVNEYVNLRRQPDFSAPVIREVPLGQHALV